MHAHEFERIRRGADDDGSSHELELAGCESWTSRAIAASSTLRRAPSTVVNAPGSGVTPRTRSWTVFAVAVKSSSPSASESLGASVTSPRCGSARAEPSARASTTSHEKFGARDRERIEQCARGLMRADRLGETWPKTSPASSSATSWKTVAPVTSSPAMIARCTGAAPRQRGKSEKCRLIQPRRGADRSGSRTRPP